MESWETLRCENYILHSAFNIIISEGLDLANCALHALKLNKSKVKGLTILTKGSKLILILVGCYVAWV